MKKTFLFFVLFFLILVNVFCFVQIDKRSMIINAVKGEYQNVIVTPLYGSVNDSAGMPFDLTADDVQYVNDTTEVLGREIAQWSVHSNFTPITIKINAESMELKTPYDGYDSQKKSEINYILYFPYKFSVSNTDYKGVLRVKSGDSYVSSKEEPISYSFENTGINTGTFPIRFMLAEDVSNNIEDYNPGIYTSTVTITVESVK